MAKHVNTNIYCQQYCITDHSPQRPPLTSGHILAATFSTTGMGIAIKDHFLFPI